MYNFLSISHCTRLYVGFRNIAVHNYDEIDLHLTYEIANEHLDDFVEFIRQVQGYFVREFN